MRKRLVEKETQERDGQGANIWLTEQQEDHVTVTSVMVQEQGLGGKEASCGEGTLQKR